MWILTLPLIFLAASIDGQMTKQEQKATGVYKLTQKERKALQVWMDHSQVTQGVPTPPSVKTPTKHPVVEENLQNGHYLRLTDQTNWEINPEDIAITQGWLFPSEIIVTKTNNPEYPYTLTNILTGSSVRARKVSQIPQAKQAQQKSQSSSKSKRTPSNS